MLLGKAQELECNSFIMKQLNPRGVEYELELFAQFYFIGARLDGSLLLMETVSTLAEQQSMNFFRESYIFNIFIFEETVNCFSEDFEV